MRKTRFCNPAAPLILLGLATSLAFGQGTPDPTVDGKIDPSKVNKTVISLDLTPNHIVLGEKTQAHWVFDTDGVSATSRFAFYTSLADGTGAERSREFGPDRLTKDFQPTEPGEWIIGVAPLRADGELAKDRGCEARLTVTAPVVNRPPTVSVQDSPADLVGGGKLRVRGIVRDLDEGDTLSTRIQIQSSVSPGEWVSVNGTTMGRGVLNLELATLVVTSPTPSRYRLVTNDGTVDSFSDPFEVRLMPVGTPPPGGPPPGGRPDPEHPDPPPPPPTGNHPPVVTNARIVPGVELDSGAAFTITVQITDPDAGDEVTVTKLQRREGDHLVDLPEARIDGLSVGDTAPIHTAGLPPLEVPYVVTVKDKAGAAAAVEVIVMVRGASAPGVLDDHPATITRITLRGPSPAEEMRQFRARNGAPEPARGTVTYRPVLRDGRWLLVPDDEITPAEREALRARYRRPRR